MSFETVINIIVFSGLGVAITGVAITIVVGYRKRNLESNRDQEEKM